jgi:hypothetical protein
MSRLERRARDRLRRPDRRLVHAGERSPPISAHDDSSGRRRPRRRHDLQPACLAGRFRRDAGGFLAPGRPSNGGRRRRLRSNGWRRRLHGLFDALGGRRGLRLRRRRRRRRRRGHHALRALGLERDRVDVAFLVGRAPHTHVHVRLARHRVCAPADRADPRSLGDLVAALHADRPELQQGHRVAVARPDRQRTTTAGNGSGERHGPRRRRAHRLAERAAHVDAAMLSSRVRVRAERERSEHRAVDRPGPRVRRTRKQQRDERARNDREPTHRRTSFVVSGVNDRTSNVAAASTAVTGGDANVERSLRSCYRERS